MDEQEFYDSLWNEFRDGDDPGTFTSWLVHKMGIINVYIERLRADLARARRAQGVPQEMYRALEMDNQRLRDQLRDDRPRRTFTPAIGQPRPAIEPTPIDPDRWVRDPGTADPSPWTRDPGPGTANDQGGNIADWNRAVTAIDLGTRRRPHQVGEQERIEALRRRIEQLQADAHDRDRGEP